MKVEGRPEPVGRVTPWDELWVGVKSQSNSVIAGSPRNSSRASLLVATGGRALNEIRWSNPTCFNQTPNAGPVIQVESDDGG